MKISKLQTIDYIIKRFLTNRNGKPCYQLIISLDGRWYTCDAVKLDHGEYIAYPGFDNEDIIKDILVHPDQTNNSSKYSSEQIQSALEIINTPEGSGKLYTLYQSPNPSALFCYLMEVIEPLTVSNDLPQILFNLQSYPDKEIKLPFIQSNHPISAVSIIEVS